MPSNDKPTVPQVILDLLERFERNREAYKSGNYNETQVRREFLDPFFKTLGWDIDNEQGFAEDYKDVIHEDAIKTTDGTKSPDYCFRIGGTRKFFLEAKRPSVDIKNDVSPAFQLRRYGFTTKLPLSILSDFEELAVYDCRFKPVKTDSAATGRILYIPFTEYATRWHEIAAIFSKEAVLKGSFDKFTESSKAKRGTADVDEAFLETIETWRKELAQNLALRNKNLSQRELNFAVQRIIDRIIFLRICEGRGIEDYGRLRALADGDKIYPRLGKLFEQADDRYNSGLFHFRAEKGRHEAPDELTLKLDLDDKLLRDILKNLYYPDSPYVFSALSADVLGQVYEQFLGKVIRLTPAHRAEVDDKPEVKKAGGVYYTPTYIVEYIVQNTVGKLLEGKTPKSAAKLKILDPACGSGSFLLGAYEHLLKWHRDFYTQNDPDKWAKGSQPVLVQTARGGWKLTISERKRILLDNIYGVDIDAQAVETTKLSLLLKVLEGETSQTIQPELLHTRALPDLGENIKCGNSLIGPDFYQQQQMTLLDEEERYRVNVFDWHAEFPQVFSRPATGGELHEAAPGELDYTVPGVPLHGSFSYKKTKSKKSTPLPEPEYDGGFDAVIGNPPYVRVQLFAHHETDYLFNKYKSASSKIDLSVFFLEKSLQLVSDKGLIGLITTKQWMTTDYGSGIRSILSTGLMKHILDFGSLPVFVNADTYPAILICQRRRTTAFSYGLVPNRECLNIQSLASIILKQVSFAQLGAGAWNLSGFDLVGNCKSRQIAIQPLADFGHVYIGDLTGMDEAFVLKRENCDKKTLKSGLLFPYAYRGAEVARYCEVVPESVVIYPYEEGQDGSPILIEEEELKKRAPKPYEHLLTLKSELRQRKDSRRLYATEDWYRHLRPGNYSYIRPEKLVFKGIDTRLSVGLLGKESVFNGANTPAFIPESLGKLSLLYLLGILNSRLIGFYLVRICPPKLGGYTRFNASNINETPIRAINFSDKVDKSRHDQMVSLVEQMLALQKSLAAAKTPPEQTSLERQIAATDQQIDRLVYQLYGLTDDEIKLVEGGQ